jgi:histidyl-tRNA synthetase
MRAVIEHNLDRGQLPVKLWYAGPFFRAERPQAGRYRQLQQVGIEAIGSEDPALDAEVIALADEGYRALGLTKYTLKLTSLGCKECRPSYRAQLQAFLASCDLDEATRARAEINPLRVLDDKREDVQKQLVNAPLQVHHLCEACKSHYDDVRRYLALHGVKWEEAPRLVRGLDYYTRTTFEFDHPMLGAQSGIGGGGRYDGLMAQLGGQELSGIGFGLGTDRTMLACQAEGLQIAPEYKISVFLIALGDAAKNKIVELSARLRAAGISNDIAFGDRALKGSMKAADKSGAQFVIVLGDGELEADVVSIKRMSDGQQTQSSLSEVVDNVSRMIKE